MSDTSMEELQAVMELISKLGRDAEAFGPRNSLRITASAFYNVTANYLTEVKDLRDGLLARASLNIAAQEREESRVDDLMGRLLPLSPDANQLQEENIMLQEENRILQEETQKLRAELETRSELEANPAVESLETELQATKKERDELRTALSRANTRISHVEAGPVLSERPESSRK
jgi:chromosome segregation ATPase